MNGGGFDIPAGGVYGGGREMADRGGAPGRGTPSVLETQSSTLARGFGAFHVFGSVLLRRKDGKPEAVKVEVGRSDTACCPGCSLLLSEE